MPMITVRYMTPENRDLSEALAKCVAELAAEQLGKDRGVTAVLAERAAPSDWFIAGRRPAEEGLCAFWVDIKITEHSNIRAETRRFVAETFAALSALLGPTHEESYVLVHAVDGDAYGYGGRTQNARFHAASSR
jgi:4-oxalocrotonate tautomerase